VTLDRPRILIASTDADYYLLLTHILEVEGYSVVLGRSVEEIVHLASDTNVHAILLATLLDCRSGETLALEACKRLKDDPHTFGIATVALIGPGAESRYIDLLKAGIDENFVRPVAPSTLLEFLRSRRGALPGSGGQTGDGQVLQYAGLELNIDNHRVRRGNIDIHLGPIEFRLLQFLMKHREQVCSRTQLIEAGWYPGRYVDAKTVNVHIGRLRNALNVAGGPDIIRTVRSTGYVLGEATVSEESSPSKGPDPRTKP
jgi:two-component system phosphate regulon response regulator PhoB